MDYGHGFLELFITLKEFNIERFYQSYFLLLKQSDDFYNITFKTSSRQRIFKLSRKTKDSEITDTNNNIILNKNN